MTTTEDRASWPATFIDVEATLAEFGFVKDMGDMLKHPADLKRYELIIEATQPEVIIETGTRTGESAAWFANLGPDVITIDVKRHPAYRAMIAANHPRAAGRIQYVWGNSLHPQTVKEVTEKLAGRKAMVSLDSDHGHAHVAAEIDAYGPLVAAGCYLVVEDGIFAYADADMWRKWHFGNRSLGNPLQAIMSRLVDAPGWYRDIGIERVHRISHHPAGFWVREP